MPLRRQGRSDLIGEWPSGPLIPAAREVFIEVGFQPVMRCRLAFFVCSRMEERAASRKRGKKLRMFWRLGRVGQQLLNQTLVECRIDRLCSCDSEDRIPLWIDGATL